eukprot:PhM_4_TR10735/c0_g2_i1/m.81976
MVCVWEWCDDGTWTPYHPADCKMLEKMFSSGSTKFTTTDLTFNADFGTIYKFDLGAMLQTNAETGTKKKLRRIDMGATEEDEEMGFVRATGSFTEKATPVAPPPPPPMAPTESVSSAPVPTAPVKRSAEIYADEESACDGDGHPAKTVKTSAMASPAPVVAAVVTTTVTTSAPPPPPTTAPPTPPTTTTTVSKAYFVPTLSSAEIAEQSKRGAQSKRGQKSIDFGPAVSKDKHGKMCFEKMLEREQHLAGEWAVFYHSYSFAALLYEVQASVAAVLFRFQSQYGTLPRLLKEPFGDLPDADALLALFPKLSSRDHDPKYRSVAICGTSSALAEDSEAPPKRVFLQGYSCADLSFTGVLESLLASCGVPAARVKSLGKEIVELSNKYGLDVRQFGGKGCKSGRAGHMLQIFMKRSIVDKYVYAAFPYGVPDKKRTPLSNYLNTSPGPIAGQVRIVCNPSVFMRGNAVRMYVYSADPTYHSQRSKFQEDMSALLTPIIGTSEVRTRAAKGIYGGELPSWFNPDDHEEQKKKKGL